MEELSFGHSRLRLKQQLSGWQIAALKLALELWQAQRRRLQGAFAAKCRGVRPMLSPDLGNEAR